MDKQKESFWSFVSRSSFYKILLSILISFLICAIILLFLNVNPIVAYKNIFASMFVNSKSFTYCLTFAIPYIATGLSVIFAFKAGIFNIGAEGQFVIGSVMALLIGLKFSNLPAIILIPFCIIGAILAGAIWGIIVAFIKIKLNVNEIISMIMLNWVALYFSNFIVEENVNSKGGMASKLLTENAIIKLPEKIITDYNFCNVTNYGIIIVILCAIIVKYVLDKTTFGYTIKAVGYNKDAAKASGININKISLLTLGISGAFSGLAGSLQLMGMGKRLSIFTMQEGFGFGGIIVALISNINPLITIIVGFFYGGIKYTGRSLNLLNMPSQLIDVIIGLIIFFISISSIFSYFKYIGKKKGGK